MSYRTEYITENGIKYEVRVYENGDRYWYLNEVLHREQGPAVECSNGNRYRYLNGKCHREDGPAIEYTTGYRAWYWNGVRLTDEVQEQGIDQLSPEEIKFWLPILAAQLAE